jgi:hypothetical protein
MYAHVFLVNGCSSDDNENDNSWKYVANLDCSLSSFFCEQEGK